jgi:hypothetical protein
MGRICRKREMRNAYETLDKILKGRDHLRALGTDEKILFNGCSSKSV